MSRFGPEVKAQVLAAIDIADIIGAALHLQPAGPGRFKALCPFHSEKTPSFVVNRARQTFHCFGCGKGGDAYTFVMEHEGLNFIEALRKLADRGGVRLPAMTERDDRQEFIRQQLLEFGKFASAHFRENLESGLKGASGRQYLKSRQLNPETVRRFGLGYAPDSWDDLRDAALRKGFKEAVLEASGMFKAGDRGLYDFFRDRLMFPIRDTSLNVVAFGGRDLSGNNPAKYINSPETAVYRKSRVLYGLSESREALRKQQTALLVEGYFDLLRCFDAGIENVVASCGTALTEEQATLLKRYVPEVTVVYDGDSAGIKAALKATGVLIRAGLTVRALALPGGQDPDDFIKVAGGEAFLKLVADAPDFVTYYATMSGDRTGNIEGRTEVAHEIFELLVEIDDAVRVDEYLKRTALSLGLNMHACRTEFDKYRRRDRSRPVAAAPGAAPEEMAPLAAFHPDDLQFLAALMEKPELLEEARGRLRDTALPDGALGEVLGGLLNGGANGHADPAWAAEAARMYAAAACTEFKDEVIGGLVHKRLVRLEGQAKRLRCEALERELLEAEREKDNARMARLLHEVIQARREVEQLGRA